MKFEKGPDLRLTTYGMEEDYAVLRHVLAEIGREAQPGWALEFGVATGTTLAMIARRLPVIGFDSFKGLPEDWRTDFREGAFKGVRPSASIPNSTIVEGLFSDTVPEYPWPKDIALVHIDCDLYSSTFTALESLAWAVHPGTYIVFDEFFGYEGAEEHEQKAWLEFSTFLRVERGLRFDIIGHGREQWAVRLRRSAA